MLKKIINKKNSQDMILIDNKSIFTLTILQENIE